MIAGPLVAVEHLRAIFATLDADREHFILARELLYREIYLGRIAYGKLIRTGPEQRVRVPRDKWQWRDAPELAIIRQEEWDAAHARIRDGQLVHSATATASC